MENKSFLHAAFSFKGRIARRPFWIAYFINSLFLCEIIFHFFSKGFRQDTEIIFTLLVTLLLLNRLALISRRFHDTGRSFIMYFGFCILAGLCGFAPVIGLFVVLACEIGIIIILCQGTNYDDETYGPAPQKSESLNTYKVEEAEDEPNFATLNGITLEEEEDRSAEETAANDESTKA